MNKGTSFPFPFCNSYWGVTLPQPSRIMLHSRRGTEGKHNA